MRNIKQYFSIRVKKRKKEREREENLISLKHLFMIIVCIYTTDNRNNQKATNCIIGK